MKILARGILVLGALMLTTIFAVPGCTPNGQAQAAQTAADLLKVEQCVIADWGKPVDVVALDCTKDELPLAVQIIADVEVLLQNRGAAPTMEYKADARVAQIVLAAQAAPQK